MLPHCEGINVDLSNVDWSDIFKGTDCESKLDKLYSVLNKTIEDHVPLHKRHHSDFPLWFSSELKSLSFEKNRAHY